MNKTIALILCLIASTAFAENGYMLEEVRGLWELAGKKSEKIKMRHQKLLNIPQDSQSVQDKLNTITESIELVEVELGDDKTVKVKLLAYLYAFKALCLGGLKNYEEAQSACIYAITLDPDNGFVYCIKGALWYEMGFVKNGAACMKIASSKGCALADEYALSCDL